MEWGKVVEKIDGVICVNCTAIYQSRNLRAAFKCNSVAEHVYACVSAFMSAFVTVSIVSFLGAAVYACHSTLCGS